jgi:hypothetical protein
MATETAQPMKVCRGFCGRSLPLEAYRLRVTGSNERHGTCPQCHAESERRRRDRKRRGELLGLAGELARVKDAEEAQRLVRGLMVRFRGPLGLAEALWKTYIAAPAGSPTAGRLILGIANLDKAVSPPPKDYSLMNDDELNERVVLLGRKVMAKAAAEADGGR